MNHKQRQLLLQFLGLYDGAIDGICGPKSQQAMEDFMRESEQAPAQLGQHQGRNKGIIDGHFADYPGHCWYSCCRASDPLLLGNQ